jgi:hypothetical protein
LSAKFPFFNAFFNPLSCLPSILCPANHINYGAHL